MKSSYLWLKEEKGHYPFWSQKFWTRESSFKKKFGTAKIDEERTCWNSKIDRILLEASLTVSSHSLIAFKHTEDL